MNRTTTAKAQRTATTAARVISAGFLVGSQTISFLHIVHAAQKLGVTDWQAYAAPVFIDGLVALGILLGLPFFAKATRTYGMGLRIAATTVSLSANIYAGGSIGGQAIGVLVVAAYIAAEVALTKIAPAESDAKATATANRSAAAAKAAATRKANAKRKAEDARIKADIKAKAAAATKARKAQSVTLDAQLAAPPAIGHDAAYL